VGKYNEQDHDEYLLENNLLGITSLEELKEAEAFVFSIRAAELERQESKFNSFTKESLKGLHFHLFQDIYPFAGKCRDVQLMKGNTRFCQVQFLESYASDIFSKIYKEKTWKSLDEAADRLAFFKSELNMLHPFREGNGRTIRIFMHKYALSKGILWDIELVEREKYMQAMIQSVVKTDLLRELFRETIAFC
jgi:cell filamentation protein